ncbi:hypothetical protein FACS1894110_14550 [Spirochaetia bacterium]|nr:hypothetical protein FACS1894110_14550 [Spirochaetia bacterium]
MIAKQFDPHGFRELRIDVWKATVEIVNSGGYQLDGAEIKINNDSIPGQTEFFKAPPKLQGSSAKHETKFSCIEADCLETANVLRNAGLTPCVLNMQVPIIRGAGCGKEQAHRKKIFSGGPICSAPSISLPVMRWNMA